MELVNSTTVKEWSELAKVGWEFTVVWGVDADAFTDFLTDCAPYVSESNPIAVIPMWQAWCAERNLPSSYKISGNWYSPLYWVLKNLDRENRRDFANWTLVQYMLRKGIEVRGKYEG